MFKPATRISVGKKLETIRRKQAHLKQTFLFQ